MANTTGNKYGGREKGTPNKLTKEIRKILKDLIHKELEKIEENLYTLDPKQRIELLIKLMPYVLPKVETINESDSESEPIQWIEIKNY
jgi:dsRNA-specific ribonuclease